MFIYERREQIATCEYGCVVAFEAYLCVQVSQTQFLETTHLPSFRPQWEFRDYVSPEALPWALTFDDEPYINIFRLNGWKFTESFIKRRPGVFGEWTNDFYERLAPGVLAEIQRTVPRDNKGPPKNTTASNALQAGDMIRIVE